ncbi:MAG: 50S ribosomal protein L21 [candidate division WS6 bacterium GW2011_GWF2_39_15]|uniref:Large ribosomal subunit protein bL21 n=1 Tax=candidate division WS6 bacterium GW2011_GWF2_39_15 TaxID=1619100 RepID=A0A0G0MZM5_9BACT|nr:MAG: 50S ribosomal protein L21 [candidate division WS6 bacterium GW2011_GWF2_39_15]
MSETKNVKAEKFAIVDVNGTQIKVTEGLAYELKKVAGAKGSKYSSDKVLLISDGESTIVGKPYITGASVEFTIDSQKKGEKINVFKYKAKARYRRSYGSRAEITRLLVKKIKTSK